jgi:beta-lactamase class A
MFQRLLVASSLLLALAMGGCAPAALRTAADPAPRWDSERELAPGVRLAHRSDARGPWAIDVVRAASDACGVEARSAKALDRVEGRETVSAIAERVGRQSGRPVLAAVNADFFRPTGVPVGAQVSDGEMVRHPGDRAVFGVADTGQPFAGVVRLDGRAWTPHGSLPLRSVNPAPGWKGASLYNRFAGEATPPDSGVMEATLRPLGGGAVGDTLRGVVEAVDTLPAGVPLTPGRVVLAARGGDAAALRAVRRGDTLRWTLRMEGAPARVRETVGGHPLLLRAGRELEDRETGIDSAFSHTRHPRTAVGWTAGGELLLVTVDGRQPGHSAGMTLAELRRLFTELGASDAINLDGGGSTSLWSGGRVVNRPSDATGERPVANALLLLGPPPGPCPAPAAALEAALRERIRRYAADTVEVSVAYRDLASGDSLLIDAHTRMHAASTMKVPVMLELFRRAERGGVALDGAIPVRNTFRSIADGSSYSLSATDDSDAELYTYVGRSLPVRELTERMITRSSNLATNLLIEHADPDRIAATLDTLGAGAMRVLRGVEDGPAFRAGMNNTTTAYALMKTLEAIAAGRAASPEATREMLAILQRQHFREMIPSGLPPGTPVANKTGWITGINHDAAIVFPPGRAPYVLVVLTRGFRDTGAAAALAGELSRLVWNATLARTP